MHAQGTLLLVQKAKYEDKLGLWAFNILFHLDASLLMEYQSSHSFSCQKFLIMT